MQLSIQVVLLAELVCEGDAGEELAPFAADGVEVEEDHQAGEEAGKDQLEDDDLAPLPVQVEFAEADVGQEGKGEEESADEAADVGEVVDPGQEAKGKEEEHHRQELEEGPPGPSQDLPALEQLHKQASQDAKLGASGADLRGTAGETARLRKVAGQPGADAARPLTCPSLHLNSWRFLKCPSSRVGSKTRLARGKHLAEQMLATKLCCRRGNRPLSTKRR